MSDLDNAINSINASAAKAENTATFLDDMSTFDDQSSVTNPNNGQTVASIPKQVKDRTDELFTAAESDINQAVSDAAQSATDAQDAADSIGRYQGLWPDTGGIADKGDTYQTKVSGTPTGQYFTALQNTTSDPIGDDVNWREVVSIRTLGELSLLSYGTVSDMLSGAPVTAIVGDLCYVDGLTFERVSDSLGSISDFSCLSGNSSALSLVRWFGSSHDFNDDTANTTSLNQLIQVAKVTGQAIDLDKENTYIPVGQLVDFDDVRFYTSNSCFIQSFSTLTRYNVDNLSKKDGLIQIPFTHRDSRVAFTLASGKVSSSINFQQELEKTPGLVTYYVIGERTPNATVDGLSIAGGFPRIIDALNQPDCGEVILTEDVYHRTDSTVSGFTCDRKIIFRSINPNGSVISSMEDNSLLSWSASNNIYSVSRANTGRVIDKSFSFDRVNSKGQSATRHLDLTKRASIAEVEANAGSWFLDVDNTLYVRTLDDRQPDGDISVLLNVDFNIQASSEDCHIVMDNLLFEGFQTGMLLSGSFIGTFSARNSQFNFTCSDTARGGLSSEGWNTYTENCGCSFNAQDGFSYHPITSTTTGSSSNEFNCFGFDNGDYTIGANNPQHNSSTSHAHCTIVRAACSYDGSLGPSVPDVGDNNRALNIAIEARGSNIQIAGNGDSRPFENTSGSKGYYIDCVGGGGAILTDTASFTDSEVFLYNSRADGGEVGNSRKFLQF